MLRRQLTRWGLVISGLFIADFFYQKTKDKTKNIKYDNLEKKALNKTQQLMDVLEDASNSEKPLYMMTPKQLRQFNQRNNHTKV